jgi:hypothetical protein
LELRVFRERDEHGFEYVIAYGEVGSSRYVSLKWFISRGELLTHYSQTDIVVERSGLLLEPLKCRVITRELHNYLSGVRHTPSEEGRALRYPGELGGIMV